MKAQKYRYVSRKSVKRNGQTEYYAMISDEVVSYLGLEKKSEKLKATLRADASDKDRASVMRSLDNEMKALDRKIAEMMKDASSEKRNRHAAPSVSAFITSMITEEEKTGISDSKRNALRRVSELWTESAGETPIDQIETKNVNSFAELLKSKNLQSNTINFYLRYSLTVFIAAEDLGVISADQLKQIRKAISSLRKKKFALTEMERGQLSTDQVKRLLSTDAPKNCKFYIDVFKLSLFTGLRYSDIRALTPSAIDEKGKCICIYMQKTKDFIKVPLNTHAMAILEEYKGSLFSSLDKDTTRIRRAIKKWCIAAGVELENTPKRIAAGLPAPEITIHTARHTFASDLINGSNTNPVLVKELLGHADLKTTQLYAKGETSAKKTAIDSLSYCLNADDD